MNPEAKAAANKALGGAALACLGSAILLWSSGWGSLAGLSLLASMVCFALQASLGLRFSRAAFSLWMAVSVAAPMLHPDFFRTWYGFELKRSINPLIMVIMFGMGTSLSLGDFKRVLLMPRPVILGVCIKYTVMPPAGKLVAMTVARGKADVAAGVVLVGSVPAGATSNVINYLAGSNAPLSVTMTALTTVASPFVTPGLTRLLGGVYLHIDFRAMTTSMMTIVVIPVALGVLVNGTLSGMRDRTGLRAALATGIFRYLPRFAMFALCAALAVLTAAARPQLLHGIMVANILSSVIVQTTLGLCLGYWAARLFRMDEKNCRTIAVEVGMQNSGVAAGLALDVLKKPLAAVPGVICSIWQNMAGALLASWWRSRPPENESRAAEASA